MYLNCGNAQARKRNRRPMEPLKAKATKAGIENPNKCYFTPEEVRKHILHKN
jgi:hypothetical protein